MADDRTRDRADEASAGAVERWRFVVAYDGSGFRGFAEQPGVPTVAGALAGALARSSRATAPLRLTCAGRTDAGVHARGQVVHADLPVPPPASGQDRPAGIDADRLVRSLNRQLAPSIVVRSAERAPDGFDARRSATARRYRYLVWNAAVDDPLFAPVAWHVAGPLDLRRMAAAADTLIGEHDFRAFCRRPPGTGEGQAIVRHVTAATWSEAGGPEVADAGPGRLLRFDIEAGSFCHQMVRSLVGCLVGVGRGRGNAATVMALLRSAGRAQGTELAPPHGLCLASVRYS